MDAKHGNSGMATVLTVALGTFMCSFDANAVNMALPLLQRSFDSTIAVVEWVAVAYLLRAQRLVAGIWPSRGHVGSQEALCGRIRGVHGELSLLRSLADHRHPHLLTGPPGAQRIAHDGIGERPGCRRRLSIAPWKGAWDDCRGGRPRLVRGPALGGLLAAAYGWKSIFLVNLPIGIGGTLLSIRAISRDGERAPGGFNPIGAALIVGALVSLLISLDSLSAGAGVSPVMLILFPAGILLATAFVFAERRARNPLLPRACSPTGFLPRAMSPQPCSTSPCSSWSFLAPISCKDCAVSHRAPRA